jgi:UDP-glucose 4-epimerase
LNLLEAMATAGIGRMVFSSTAAVYGEPVQVPITEEALCLPVNAYGESKLAFERMLTWYRQTYGLRYMTLRYFSACGATRERGEFHVPETHLSPVLLRTATGMRGPVSLYGTDYDTSDGTCIRDYVHVADIARAHVLALDAMDQIQQGIYNMGNETGCSNAEVIETVERVTGRRISVIPCSRRAGDPARLVASSQRIRRDLGWAPAFPNLEAMVSTAWEWYRHHPDGYAP